MGYGFTLKYNEAVKTVANYYLLIKCFIPRNNNLR